MAGDNRSELRLKALEQAADLIRQEITLASATLVLSGTFLGSVFKGLGEITGETFLLASWAALLLSVLTGLFSLGRYSTLLHEGQINVEDAWLTWLMRIQQIMLVTGFTLLIVFASSNVGLLGKPSAP